MLVASLVTVCNLPVLPGDSPDNLNITFETFGVKLLTSVSLGDVGCLGIALSWMVAPCFHSPVHVPMTVIKYVLEEH